MSGSDHRNAPPNPAEDPRELARRLAEQAKARAAAAVQPTPPPAPPPPPTPDPRRLADRAGRPVSVEDALRRAIEEERSAADRKEAYRKEAARTEQARADASRIAAEAKARLEAEARTRSEAEASAAALRAAMRVAVGEPAAPAAAQAPMGDPLHVLRERLGDAAVDQLKRVDNRVVFQALWQAHRARAVADGDLAVIVTADVLLDADKRVPAGALFAARVGWRGQTVAVWVDAQRGTLLAFSATPDIHLAGL